MKRLPPKKAKGKENKQILTYPIPVRADEAIVKKLEKTLKLARVVANHYLEIFYQKEWLERIEEITIESEKKAYKDLEPLAPERNKNLPSRINRGILEIVGRALRSIQARKALYRALVSLDNDPARWDYRRLIDTKGIFAKSEYVHNLAEQTQNYLAQFSPWLLRLEDFGEILVEKIKNGQDPLSQYLRENFSADLQAALNEYTKGEQLSPLLADEPREKGMIYC